MFQRRPLEVCICCTRVCLAAGRNQDDDPYCRECWAEKNKIKRVVELGLFRMMEPPKVPDKSKFSSSIHEESRGPGFILKLKTAG